MAAPASRRAGFLPNPMSGTTQLEYSVPGVGTAVLEVYDVRGRLVRRSVVSRGTGSGTAAWDGRDTRGEPVPDGVYFLRLRDGELTGTVKVAVIR